MRTAPAALVLAVGLSLAAPRAEACSIRGQFCNYPSWAANVFEGPHGFKGNPAILTEYYRDQPPRKVVPRRPRSAR